MRGPHARIAGLASAGAITDLAFQPATLQDIPVKKARKGGGSGGLREKRLAGACGHVPPGARMSSASGNVKGSTRRQHAPWEGDPGGGSCAGQSQEPPRRRAIMQQHENRLGWLMVARKLLSAKGTLSAVASGNSQSGWCLPMVDEAFSISPIDENGFHLMGSG